MVDLRVPSPGLTFFGGDGGRFDDTPLISERRADVAGEAASIIVFFLIDPFVVAFASAGLGRVRPLRTVLVPGRARPSSAPRVDIALDK